MTDLIDPIVALLARWREEGTSHLRHSNLTVGNMYNDHADQLDAVLPALRARIANLEQQPQMVQVTQPNGEPLPAPCAISGCQYDALTSAADPGGSAPSAEPPIELKNRAVQRAVQFVDRLRILLHHDDPAAYRETLELFERLEKAELSATAPRRP